MDVNCISEILEAEVDFEVVVLVVGILVVNMLDDEDEATTGIACQW